MPRFVQRPVSKAVNECAVVGRKTRRVVAYSMDTEAVQTAVSRPYRRHCTAFSCALASYFGVLCIYSAEMWLRGGNQNAVTFGQT